MKVDNKDFYDCSCLDKDMEEVKRITKSTKTQPWTKEVVKLFKEVNTDEH